MSQTVYDSYLKAAASARAAGFPINPLAAAAQACHETGFGASTPPQSHNVLGIKAGRSWTGPTVDARTHEYYNGQRNDNVIGRWRVYPSVQACFEDYGSIIQRLWWFDDAEQHADGDPFDYLTALKPIYGPDGHEVVEPGYFTDPSYVVNVMKIVRQYGQPAQPSFEQQYPAMQGVTELWVDDVLRSEVLIARQVNHKLFVKTTNGEIAPAAETNVGSQVSTPAMEQLIQRRPRRGGLS